MGACELAENPDEVLVVNLQCTGKVEIPPVVSCKRN